MTGPIKSSEQIRLESIELARKAARAIGNADLLEHETFKGGLGKGVKAEWETESQERMDAISKETGLPRVTLEKLHKKPTFMNDLQIMIRSNLSVDN